MNGNIKFNEPDRLCNRHMRRLLDDLEAADCPACYRERIKQAFRAIRAEGAIVGHGKSLMLDLQEARCPEVFIGAADVEIEWLRDDLAGVNQQGKETE
jgi:hypothetical protein